MKGLGYLWIIAILLSGAGIANAQSTQANGIKADAASAELINTVRKTKADSEALVKLQEDEVKRATEKLEQLRQLVTDGLVARNELESAEESLASLQSTLDATRQRIDDSDQIIAEIQSAEIQKNQSIRQAALINKNRTLMRPAVLRYNGAANWSISHLAGIQSFFSSTFGRALPTSTVGQSATHNRLGWDHRNSVDVPLHPDSAEGRMLITFLQTQGIPFLAFRGAIPGVSTGPHIHIGRPSQRLS